MTTRYGRAILIALLFLCAGTGTVQARPDALQGQIRMQHAAHGLEVARGVAEGFGLLLREVCGQRLVPVIVDRKVSWLGNFQSRLSATGARLDAESRSYPRILVPLSRLDKFIDAVPEA